MRSFTSLAARVAAFTVLGLAMLWQAAGTARADGLTELENFLRQTQQGRATFTQVVTPPQKVGDTRARAKTSSGQFEFQRPDRFRFEYTRPFEQTIVADGQTLWLHDVDLNQVSARRQQEVLGNTPAALLAAAADLKALGRVFDLRSDGASDGTEWVQATPKQRDGQLQLVRIGFRQGQLAVLDILDSFGQRSVMTFGALDLRPGFKPDHFRFTPPAGADVIRQ